ncbi:MAG: hypothetical protein V2I54_00360 [Bacteroidales bacterium]|jgi:hypothetical protein|nr:hypothetical protein [Bacteroidales bacterium]
MNKMLWGLVFLALGTISEISAQILHTESFSVILDTTRKIKGSIVPDFKFENQKKDLVEFENISDITFLIKNSALTFANKIELSKYGDEVLLSGGYLYIEYGKIVEKKFSIDPFSQVHWSEARGLEFKYAGGFYTRYRIIQKEMLGFFAGLGTFYEHERWNYEGVVDTLLIPSTASNIYSDQLKLGSYLSFKYASDYNFSVDVSIYHQSRYDEIFSTPRLAGSASITYNFTKHLGLIAKYQNIYDYNPLVPIEKLFNRFVLALDISF